MFIVQCEWLLVLLSVLSWRGGPYALIMLLVSIASGPSEGARFKLHSKTRRRGAELQGQRITLAAILLPPSLKQDLGRDEGKVI